MFHGELCSTDTVYRDRRVIVPWRIVIHRHSVSGQERDCSMENCVPQAQCIGTGDEVFHGELCSTGTMYRDRRGSVPRRIVFHRHSVSGQERECSMENCVPQAQCIGTGEGLFHGELCSTGTVYRDRRGSVPWRIVFHRHSVSGQERDCSMENCVPQAECIGTGEGLFHGELCSTGRVYRDRRGIVPWRIVFHRYSVSGQERECSMENCVPQAQCIGTGEGVFHRELCSTGTVYRDRRGSVPWRIVFHRHSVSGQERECSTENCVPQAQCIGTGEGVFHGELCSTGTVYRDRRGSVPRRIVFHRHSVSGQERGCSTENCVPQAQCIGTGEGVFHGELCSTGTVYRDRRGIVPWRIVFHRHSVSGQERECSMENCVPQAQCIGTGEGVFHGELCSTGTVYRDRRGSVPWRIVFHRHSVSGQERECSMENCVPQAQCIGTGEGLFHGELCSTGIVYRGV